MGQEQGRPRVLLLGAQRREIVVKPSWNPRPAFTRGSRFPARARRARDGLVARRRNHSATADAEHCPPTGQSWNIWMNSRYDFLVSLFAATFLGELLEKRWMEPIVPFTLKSWYSSFSRRRSRSIHIARELQQLMLNFAEQGSWRWRWRSRCCRAGSISRSAPFSRWRIFCAVFLPDTQLAVAAHDRRWCSRGAR